MAKPDPALLDPARYPYHGQIETRYRDVDGNQHLNNGVIASLLEEGRVRFHRASQFGGVATDPDLSALVARVAIDYLSEGFWPEPLDMHVGIGRMGNSSYELCQLITQHGKAVTLCSATMVFFKNNAPWPIAEDHREMAKAWMLLP
jgi:acyl-CoA thioester hydrolase